MPLLERCEPAHRDRARPRSGRAPAPQPTALDVVEADVLEVDVAASAAGCAAAARLRVVGNLPYNISTPILFHLLDVGRASSPTSTSCCRRKWSSAWPPRPAARTTAGSRVMLQWRYEIEALFDVPPEAFEPPPRVDSAVLRMMPRPVAGGDRSGAAARDRDGRLLAAAQAPAPHDRPLARGARLGSVVRPAATRRRSAGRRMDRPRRSRSKKRPRRGRPLPLGGRGAQRGSSPDRRRRGLAAP